MDSKEFKLGNMCDDLVDLTLDICGKQSDSCPRFPRWSYESYVDRIVRTALDIQELVITCNEYRKGDRRSQAQIEAAGKCVYLNHLIRIAWKRGYISDKQQERWAKLVTSIKWKIVSWYRADIK